MTVFRQTFWAQPFLWLLWGGALTPHLAAGDFRFETARVEITVKPDQTEVAAVFPFINEGAAPARIESVTSDCACIKAEAPPGDIAPGGRGTVRSLFKVGNYLGTVEKQVVASVRHGGGITRIPLTVTIIVPELIKIEPRTLSWTLGQAPEAKTFRVRMVGDPEIRLLKVECNRQEFQLRTETVTAGREYLVHVTPLQTDPLCIGLCVFQTDCKFEKFRTPSGFLHIRRP
jgi:hypothetical protein